MTELDSKKKPSAFELRAQECDRAVLRLVLSVTGGEREASDLYQEIFAKLHADWNEAVAHESFQLLAFRAAATRCLEYLQGAEQHPRSGRRSCSQTASALALLTPRERLVFDLKHFLGFRLMTIAEILDANEAGVNKVFCRAARKLSFALGEIKSENASRV